MDKKKQFYWYANINYISFALSLISLIYIFPINIELLGEIRYVETLGFLIYPLFLFGLAQSLVNFNPLLDTQTSKLFFGNCLLIISFMFACSLIILFVFNYLNPIGNFNYYLMGLVLGFILALIELLKNQAILLRQVIVPLMIEKIGPRLLIIFVFYLSYINFSYLHFETIYVFFYALLAFVIASYVFRTYQPIFSLNYQPIFQSLSKKEVVSFSFFALLANFGSLLALKIDSLMIPFYLGMKYNGLYSIATIFPVLIAIPSTASFALNAPSISYHIKNKNFQKLERKYVRVAKDLFYKAGIFFSLTFTLLPDFFDYFLPENKDYIELLPVINLLCLGAFVNVSTGFNNEIILFSNYYRYNLIFIFIGLVLSSITLNYYFLTQTHFGLLGVAVASAISLSVYNLIKIIFIKKKFGILPFDSKFLAILGILLFVLILVNNLPLGSSFGVKLILKTGLIFLLNIVLVKYWKLMDEIRFF